MSETIQLKAQPRTRTGKGAAREMRRNSMVPAVIYGDNKDPLTVTLPYKDLSIEINKGGFMNKITELDLDGTKHRVLAKAVQTDPVRDFFIHVDFLRVGINTRVTVEIPVHYINEEECPGIRRGGVLNVVRYTLEVNCPANSIPEAFEIDLTGLEIDDVVHASKIQLPEEVRMTITDRDPTMCSIAAPTLAPADEEEKEGEEVAADEVPTEADEAAEEGGEE